MKTILASLAIYAMAFILWRHAQPSGIVFYQGVLLATLVSLGQFGFSLFTHRPWRQCSAKDSAFTFLLLYSLMFTVPTTVDRAYSVRMILEMERSPDGLTKSQIEHWFATDFQSEGGVDKRLREQIATGSLKQNGSRYELTPFGHFLAQAFAGLRWLFANSGNERPIAVPSAAPATSKTPA